MADLLKIGTVAQRTGTSRYDLLSKASGNIYVSEIMREKADGDYIVMRYKCKAFSSTHTQIQAAEEKIQDQLINADKYTSDIHRSAPVFLWMNADGITERKRMIVKGELICTNEEYMTFHWIEYELLLWCYPPWEGVTETTEVNASTMDGVTNHIEMTSILGDVPGRISEFTVRGTATNTEAAPLVEAFFGIRPEYQSMDAFDPVLDLEHGDNGSDTATASVDDSNTYPNGSSSNNVKQCDFSGTTTDATRVTLSLDDVWKNGTEIMDNGGFEEGDLTDWTLTLNTGDSAVQDTTKNEGTYAVKMDVTGDAGGGSDKFEQSHAVTAGAVYRWNVDSKFVDIASSEVVSYYVLRFLDSGSSQTGDTIDGRFFTAATAADAAWVERSGYAVAPSDAATIDFTIYAGCENEAGYSVEFYIDAVSIVQTNALDWDGDYMVLLRAKVDGNEVDVYGRYGYDGTTVRPQFGKTQPVTNTDWKLIPLGMVSIPPERQLTDEETIWRLSKITFDISAAIVSGAPTIDFDCLVLIPCMSEFYADDVSIARSSYTVNAAGDEYYYADLHAYRTALDELVVIAEDESFVGINTNVRWSTTNWSIPAEDCLLVGFCQRTASHEIADDFVVTLKYYPRYIRRYSD